MVVVTRRCAKVIFSLHLCLYSVFDPGPAGSGPEPIGPAAARTTAPSRPTLNDVERAYIVQVCEDCGWQIKGPDSASVRLGLKPSTLYFRMRKFGIVRPAVTNASSN
jgi:transcriptional regulator with GAF, ATPase, and Fis domain